MASDRTQYKQVLVGVVGALRTVSNAFKMVAQDAQRFETASVGAAATAATGTQNFLVARVERPVQLIEARILPGGALVGAAGNFQTISFGYTNDASSSVTVLAQCNTNGTTLNTTPFPSTTGNWAFGTSILVAQNASQNQVIPSGSFIVVQAANTGAAGIAMPAGTVFQLLVEEV